MSKLFLTGLAAAAALGLAACGGAEENNVATNLEDLNATEDLNMDMNMDMNADLNADLNADVNATDNATGNEAIDNSANSY